MYTYVVYGEPTVCEHTAAEAVCYLHYIRTTQLSNRPHSATHYISFTLYTSSLLNILRYMLISTAPNKNTESSFSNPLLIPSLFPNPCLQSHYSTSLVPYTHVNTVL
jgi:hypothetical protein